MVGVVFTLNYVVGLVLCWSQSIQTNVVAGPVLVVLTMIIKHHSTVAIRKLWKGKVCYIQ